MCGQVQAREILKTHAGREMIAELLRRYQAGDAYAAEALVDVLSPALLAFFERAADGRRSAEQALKVCWAEIHRARRTYRPGAPPLAWVFAIATHVRRRRRELLDGRESGGWAARCRLWSERRAAVEQETKDLLAASPLTMAEIARAVGISPRRAERIGREAAA